MRTTKNTTTQKSVEKEVKQEISFFDKHVFHWFIDTEKNELKIGSDFSDFLNKKTENFSVKRVHYCDVKTWTFVETTDGKFLFLTTKKGLK